LTPGLRGAGQLAIVLLVGIYLFAGSMVAQEHGHDDDHGAEHTSDVPEDHGLETGQQAESAAVHDEHDEDSDHAGHDEDVVVRVSRRGSELAGIRIARAAKVAVGRAIVLPGEVGFNEDQRVHVTPRYGGVIKEMRAALGARVEKDDVLALVESNENLTSYPVLAPLSGRIVARQGAVGAHAPEETAMFVVADLSSVWVDLVVYPRHLSDVREGARVVVHAVGATQTASGTVSYVAPVFDRDRRVALARVVLANSDGRWRPGMFVRAELDAGTGSMVTAVERSAVQTLDAKTVVFVPTGDTAYRAVPVTVGESGATHTEILSGLDLGDAYVASGAFELKAEVVTSSLGGHAGHGH
jgi:cobalt-zinc-cadmium efflux system membrane fusion protein